MLDVPQLNVGLFNSIVAELGFDPARYTIDAPDQPPHIALVRSAELTMRQLVGTLVVGRLGDGLKNVPVDELTAAGIPVFFAPGVNSESVADLVMIQMGNWSRNVMAAMAAVQAIETGDPVAFAAEVERVKKPFVGRLRKRKTLGIIGLGHIGRELAQLAMGAGMRVIGTDAFMDEAAAAELIPGVKFYSNVKKMLAECDYVSIHIPHNDDTKGYFSEALIKATKRGAVLINFARLEVINLPAVIKALDEGHLSGLLSDFGHPDLRGREDVLLTPHLGSGCREAQDACAAMVVKAVTGYTEHGTIAPNSANFPEVYLERDPDAPYRITVAHDDVESTKMAILGTISARHINLADDTTKRRRHPGRPTIAYTIIDIDSPADKELLNKIRSLPGVRPCSVRYLPLPLAA